MSTIHPAKNATLTNAKSPETDESTREELAAAAGRAHAAAEDAVSQVASTAQDGFEQVRGGLEKVGRDARRLSERQPLLVAGGALLVGVALGLAINSRRRS